jgi:hypothetical protein
MIIIGDLHCKTQMPYYLGIKKFFEWLILYYKQETIIFLGDLFDTSSPHNKLRLDVAKYLKQLEEVYILQGNHDVSRRMGSALLYLNALDNVTIIEDVTEIQIDLNKFENLVQNHHTIINCLFLPFKYNCKEEYEALEGEYDYIFTHITPPQCAFGDEGINLKVKGAYYHGHTHMQKAFTVDEDEEATEDSYFCRSWYHEVVGVPIPTRHLEQKQEHRIFKITPHRNKEEIQVPQTFTFRNIKFGEEIKEEYKNDILNITHAPSYPAALEMYKDFYVRKAGITIQRTEDDIEFDRENLSIEGSFRLFANKTEGLSREVISCCLEHLKET